MLVNLTRNWFDPEGTRRRVSDNPHSVPDDWKDQLPSTAEILKDGGSVTEDLTSSKKGSKTPEL